MLVAAISNRVDCRRRYSSPCTRQFRSIQRFANTVEDGVHSGQIVEASNHPGGPPIAITLIVRQAGGRGASVGHRCRCCWRGQADAL